MKQVTVENVRDICRVVGCDAKADKQLRLGESEVVPVCSIHGEEVITHRSLYRFERDALMMPNLNTGITITTTFLKIVRVE